MFIILYYQSFQYLLLVLSGCHLNFLLLDIVDVVEFSLEKSSFPDFNSNLLDVVPTSLSFVEVLQFVSLLSSVERVT